MLMYINGDEKRKLGYEELYELGIKLRNFVDVYYRNIMIYDKEDIKRLKMLNRISELILDGNHDMLFEDPEKIVNYSKDEVVDETFGILLDDENYPF